MIWLIYLVGLAVFITVAADDWLYRTWHSALFQVDEWKRSRNER